jgi:phosphoserine phosphatase
MTSPEAARRLYLLRHGETLYTSADRTGSLLTERGHRQLDVLAALFEDLPLDAIYSSPIGRARLTAGTIADRVGLPITEVEALREIRAGGPPDRDRQELYDQVRDYFLRSNVDLDEPYCGGESFRQLGERIGSFFDDLWSRADWRRVVVVAHSGVNRAYLGQVLRHQGPGLPPFEQDFGCLNIIDQQGDQLIIRLLNFTAHDPLKIGLDAAAIEIWYEHALRGLRDEL